ncbi:transposase [Spinactinospora alkalitolerans]|uniref:Transposase n=1 Tax=Spinactinospora alkalitolerans TaxID=687207 RepID=A0A852TPD7_9ACTN|nr:transposase [Spinactinospora alkalitolerans]
MPRTRPTYPSEYREHIIELARTGRTPEELAREFEPFAQTIRNRIAQGRIDVGQRPGLTSQEKAELGLVSKSDVMSYLD